MPKTMVWFKMQTDIKDRHTVQKTIFPQNTKS